MSVPCGAVVIGTASSGFVGVVSVFECHDEWVIVWYRVVLSVSDGSHAASV